MRVLGVRRPHARDDVAAALVLGAGVELGFPAAGHWRPVAPQGVPAAAGLLFLEVEARDDIPAVALPVRARGLSDLVVLAGDVQIQRGEPDVLAAPVTGPEGGGGERP